jgi:hypothetical protein
MEQAGVKLVVFEIFISLVSVNEDILVTAAPKLLSSVYPNGFNFSAKESWQSADALGVVSCLGLSFFGRKFTTINLHFNYLLLITESAIK